MKKQTAQWRWLINLLLAVSVICVSLSLYAVLFPPHTATYTPQDTRVNKRFLVPDFQSIKPVTKPLQPPDAGALVGISFYDFDMQNLQTLETALDRHFAIIGMYTSWGAANNAFNEHFAQTVRSLSAVPLISWEPWIPVSGYDRSEEKVDEKDYRLSLISGGKYDAYITRFAQNVKTYGYPVIIRFAHEMNGNWYSWGSTFNTPEEYITAWRHVHDIFLRIGATNATWLWSPNEIYSDAHVPYAHKILAFYPGDSYTDWVGFSSFNWAGLYKHNVWRDPENMYDQTVHVLSTLKKPVFIAETASAASNSAALKAQWIMELAHYLKNRPQVKGVVWFDTKDNGIDWRIESNPTYETAFKNAFDGYFIGSLTD